MRTVMSGDVMTRWTHRDPPLANHRPTAAIKELEEALDHLFTQEGEWVTYSVPSVHWHGPATILEYLFAIEGRLARVEGALASLSREVGSFDKEAS